LFDFLLQDSAKPPRTVGAAIAQKKVITLSPELSPLPHSRKKFNVCSQFTKGKFKGLINMKINPPVRKKWVIQTKRIS
jgi:hypothetical protein